MRFTAQYRSLFLLSFLLELSAACLQGAGASTNQAWQQVGVSIGAAHRAFARLTNSEQGAEAREVAFGFAVSGFERQPFAEMNVASSRQQLRTLIAVDAKDEIGIRAQYALGRSRQLYGSIESALVNPELSNLVHEQPKHYLTQMAVVKLMLHRLYAVDSDEPALTRLTAAESMRGLVTEPGLQCGYHILLGDAYLFFGDQRSAALRHFEEAERIGISNSSARARVLVQIGELARLEGNAALALEAYRKFLGEFNRDIRVLIIRRRLEDVERCQNAIP